MNVLELSGTALGGLIFLPGRYNGHTGQKNVAEEELPLLVYLHGAGERGTKTEHMCRHGIPRLITREGLEIPAVVLCPQCPADYVWNNVVREVKAVIDSTVRRFSMRHDRISLTGCSMGGFGAWEMGMTYTGFFSALAPVAGGGLSFRAGNLRTTPIRAYHGTADELVPAVYSTLMTEAVLACGGHAELTLFPGLGHNEGIEYAYGHTDMIDWLLAQRRTDHTPEPEFLSEYF